MPIVPLANLYADLTRKQITDYIRDHGGNPGNSWEREQAKLELSGEQDRKVQQRVTDLMPEVLSLGYSAEDFYGLDQEEQESILRGIEQAQDDAEEEERDRQRYEEEQAAFDFACDQVEQLAQSHGWNVDYSLSAKSEAKYFTITDSDTGVVVTIRVATHSIVYSESNRDFFLVPDGVMVQDADGPFSQNADAIVALMQERIEEVGKVLDF